ILIYRASGIVLTSSSKEDIDKNVVWNKIENMYNYNKFIDVKLDEIDDKFFSFVLEFLLEFCENNYQYLDNMLAWLYQYLNINTTDNINKDTQFFTDQYMVEYLVNVSISQLNKKNIKNIDSIDPACGGGNFIVALIEKLYNILGLNEIDFIEYVEKHIFG
ncbi:hypothetical protein, partial [Clostridium perfringens]|uniref:hypothetical protein n=1 Tax=Clostridium perfringens TaxID=1502 RepID=UPI002ACBEB6D